mmetsp:Transcript_1757/g.6920  ORF Transcript_1757/g.6920 Transcript_1757/m.6920 type:complete len:217 (+) Transcript_1757:795-1445(+)
MCCRILECHSVRSCLRLSISGVACGDSVGRMPGRQPTGRAGPRSGSSRILRRAGLCSGRGQCCRSSAGQRPRQPAGGRPGRGRLFEQRRRSRGSATRGASLAADPRLRSLVGGRVRQSSRRGPAQPGAPFPPLGRGDQGAQALGEIVGVRFPALPRHFVARAHLHSAAGVLVLLAIALPAPAFLERGRAAADGHGEGRVATLRAAGLERGPRGGLV